MRPRPKVRRCDKEFKGCAANYRPLHCFASLLDQVDGRRALLVDLRTLPAPERRHVDFAGPFLRLVDTAKKVSETRGTRDGRPVRVIVLKLTPKLPPEATSIFSVKFTEDQMTVWLGDDNIPLAAERIQRGTAGFMFIKGSMTNRSTWTFARYGDRLVVLRDDTAYAGSGFGQKGEGRSVQVVTVK